MLRALSLALLASLAACHLVDQRDFNPKAGTRPTPPVAPAPPPGPGALLTISFAAGDPAYAPALAQGVQRALGLKPDVLFTVQTLVPVAETPDAQAESLRAAAATGREIGEAIVTDGADQGQIELAVRADPSVHAKEVRIFVH
jgi:hypothetical protein